MAIKLLLADESITIRKVFQKTFSKNDYELTWIDRHDNIIDSVKRVQPDFVLLSDSFPGIKLDTDIPEISSFTQRPDSVIVLGDRRTDTNQKTAVQAGAGGFFYKPIDNRLIKNLLEKLSKQEIHPASTVPEPVHPQKAHPHLIIPPPTDDTVDQRAKILFDIFESYFNENILVITDAITKAIAPRLAADIASRIIEHIEITDLPKQIMKMTISIVNDLIPQITERVVAREIESIKAEAIRLLEEEDENENV